MIHTNWKSAELKKLILAVTGSVIFLSAVSASFATQFAVGYNLRISEDLNVLQNPDSTSAQMMAAWTTPTALANQRNHPYLLLENTATTANHGSGNAALTTFSISVGDPAMNFDWGRIISTSPGVTATLLAPDTLENGVRGNAITYNFSGLTPGKQVIFQVDIDPNATNGDQFADYRQVLFHVSPSGAPVDPDTSHNAITTIGFHDPSSSLVNTTLPPQVWPNVSVPYQTVFGMQIVSQYMQDHVDAFDIGALTVPEPSTLAMAGLGFAGLILRMRRPRR
jgi:PEP-CTERM motif